ncbi:MAG: hypothetical protein AAB546_00875 [Patescibacteria group bacterium]
MKLNTAERKSKASNQSWHKHIDAFYQRLANKKLRREAKDEIKKEL